MGRTAWLWRRCPPALRGGVTLSRDGRRYTQLTVPVTWLPPDADGVRPGPAYVRAHVLVTHALFGQPAGGGSSGSGWGAAAVGEGAAQAAEEAVEGDSRRRAEPVVMHFCHTEGCVNGAHLAWGTRSNNKKDDKATHERLAAAGAHATWGGLTDLAAGC